LHERSEYPSLSKKIAPISHIIADVGLLDRGKLTKFSPERRIMGKESIKIALLVNSYVGIARALPSYRNV
jgi:hypothetical protein